MFFMREETPAISNIEERIAQWVMMDKNQGEGLQVLFYKASPPPHSHHITVQLCGAPACASTCTVARHNIVSRTASAMVITFTVLSPTVFALPLSQPPVWASFDAVQCVRQSQ